MSLENSHGLKEFCQPSHTKCGEMLFQKNQKFRLGKGPTSELFSCLRWLCGYLYLFFFCSLLQISKNTFLYRTSNFNELTSHYPSISTLAAGCHVCLRFHLFDMGAFSSLLEIPPFLETICHPAWDGSVTVPSCTFKEAALPETVYYPPWMGGTNSLVKD